jgi:hypothetical protein
VDRDVDPARELGLAAGEVAVEHGDALVEKRQELVVAAEALREDVERGLARQVVDALDAVRESANGRGR